MVMIYLMRMKTINSESFNVVVTQDEDGMFMAQCHAIPSCYAEGKTREEAIQNIKKVIELCLEVAKNDKEYRDKIDFSDTVQSAQFA